MRGKSNNLIGNRRQKTGSRIGCSVECLAGRKQGQGRIGAKEQRAKGAKKEAVSSQLSGITRRNNIENFEKRFSMGKINFTHPTELISPTIVKIF